jgi:hypothetical protein
LSTKIAFSIFLREENSLFYDHRLQKLNFIRTAKAFCRVQNCPPDDLRWVCVVVMRSDASTSPDGDLHATSQHDSLSAADTDSSDYPNCCSLEMTEKSMLKKKKKSFNGNKIKRLVFSCSSWQTF